METATFVTSEFIEAMDSYNDMEDDVVLISKIDTTVGKQYGENNHIEYSWQNDRDVEEQILQMSFQLVRCDEYKREDLRLKFADLLKRTFETEDRWLFARQDYDTHVGSILFRIIAQTRDIISGKGEYSLFYMMVYELAFINMDHAKFLIHSLVYDDNKYESPYIVHELPKEQPIGSWKDMKYMIKYFNMKSSIINNEKSYIVTNELNNYIFGIICTQLREDDIQSSMNGGKISLAAKWIPREKSKKYEFIFNILAEIYYSNIITVPATHSSYTKAINKTYMMFRKLLTKLNAKLDTTQIKQCNYGWSDINFKNVTSITMNLQKNAFLNLKKDGKTERYPEDFDRIECKEHFQEFLQNVKSGNQVMKGKRVSIVDMVRGAYTMKQDVSQDIIDTLNAQWDNNSSQTGLLENFIAMVDTSGSMTVDNSNPLYSAIGLGIRVAEKSSFGKRVLTFSASPNWINLDDNETPTFVEKVKKIANAEWGMNTNFYAAMKMILDVIILSKMPPTDVENMVLAVFSDMQVNQADQKYSTNSMSENIISMYAAAGIKNFGKPYKPPHILFWNLRSTDGFPSVSTAQNMTMLSGYSPSLLNIFCEKGVEGFKTVNPWNTLCETLTIKRYKRFSDYFMNYYNPIQVD